MNNIWLVDTHGDPLGTIQNVFAETWGGFHLDAMIVPANGNGVPRLISDPDELSKVNPFKPLMTFNTAKYLPDILEEDPELKIGAILRPCEVRALEGKSKSKAFPTEHMLTISIDCLGTYSPEDYQWRSERKGSPEKLAGETLNFARQGGIAAYRFRSACQACQTPVGSGADINIGVIGLPVRQKIMIEVRDTDAAVVLRGSIESDPKEQALIEQRKHVTARLLQRGSQTRQRLSENLESILPRDLDGLIQQFDRCGECRACFEVCPLCAEDYPAKDSSGIYIREEVKQWMISCAGCGMCEQSCPNHLPLATIFAHIRQQLTELSEVQPVN